MSRTDMHVDRGEIIEGLDRIGISKGDVVMVHSSLSRFGHVDGGAEAVIDALTSAVGGDGTLMMSAITTNPDLVIRCIASSENGIDEDTPVDLVTTETWAGRIAETFRLMPGVVRSLHPTHSVTARGALAAELLEDHHLAPGPCGEGSPFGRLMDHERGLILLLGVNHKSNTALHGVEELAGLEYVLYPKPSRIRVRGPQGIVEATTRVHTPFLGRDLGIFESVYIDAGAERVGMIGASPVRLINARLMKTLTLERLEAKPDLLLSEDGKKSWDVIGSTGDYTRKTGSDSDR